MRNINSKLVLNRDEVHLWFAFPDEIQDPSLISEYEKLLSPEEHKKHKRFVFERHRHQYLVTQALVRINLSRYTGIPPADIQFIANEYGKPELNKSQNDSRIQFNLSHTQGLIAMATVRDRDIGIDVEDMERREVSTDIVDRFFSKTEIYDFKKVPKDDKCERFFEYWTLKESYIKAKGMGLSIPLSQFSFHLSEGDSIRISFGAELEDDPACWQFWLLNPTNRHKSSISLSIDSKADSHYRLVSRKIIPLMEEEPYDCQVVNQSSPNLS